MDKKNKHMAIQVLGKMMFAIALIAMLAGLTATPASASIINISSITSVGVLDATSLIVNFTPTAPADNCDIGGGGTGVFAGVGGTCDAYDFANSTSASASPFLTLTSQPGTVFVLTGADAAVGSTLGPIVQLFQIGPNVFAQIGVFGTGTYGGSTAFTWSGGLSTQLSNTTVAAVQKNGIVDKTWSATLETDLRSEVPEPGTYALMGVGLTALAFIGRRKRGGDDTSN